MREANFYCYIGHFKIFNNTINCAQLTSTNRRKQMGTKHELYEVAILERFVIKYKLALYIGFTKKKNYKILFVKPFWTYHKIESDGFDTKPDNETPSTVITVSCMLFNLVISFRISIKLIYNTFRVQWYV